MTNYILIADIGGTNSNLALIEISKSDFKFILKKEYKTASIINFSDFLNTFLTYCVDKHKILIERAVFGVAGKINEEKIKLTNSDLKIDLKDIKNKTSLKSIILVNDFTAISYGIEKLNSTQIKTLNKGKSLENKPKVVIGAGTGLGKSLMLYNQVKGYITVESEAGHCDFPAQNEQELNLVDFIKKKYSKTNVELEDVLSGNGLENIYEFLSGKTLSAKEISEKKGKNKHAKMAFVLFYKFYARASKNFALDNLATGGVYLAGGIIEKNMTFSKKDFLIEFTNNEKFKNMLKDIPIYVVKDYDVSLIGLANYVLKQ